MSAAKKAKEESVGAMNVRQAAQHLGVSVDTIYRYANEGILPALRVGNRWRFPVKSLNEWMQKEAHKGVVKRAS